MDWFNSALTREFESFFNTKANKFFIKIDDFETVYKRLLLRELDKIVLNHKL